MKKLRCKILQKIADFIYKRLITSPNDIVFNGWYDLGMRLDSYAISKDIYLN